MRRLASGLIVYTESQAASVRAVPTDVAVTAAVKALYRQSDLGRPRPGALVTDLVCVGRLAATKRPELLASSREALISHVRLLFILADGARHGPEIESARPDESVVRFRSCSTDALARAMLDVVAERDVWLARRSWIEAAAHPRYSIEAMATSFIVSLYPAPANDGAR